MSAGLQEWIALLIALGALLYLLRSGRHLARRLLWPRRGDAACGGGCGGASCHGPKSEKNAVRPVELVRLPRRSER